MTYPHQAWSPVPAYFTDIWPAADRPIDIFGPPSGTGMIKTGADFPELGMKPVDYDVALHPDHATYSLKVDGIGVVWIDGWFYSLNGNIQPSLNDQFGKSMRALEKKAGMKIFAQFEFEAGDFRQTLSALKSGHLGRLWLLDCLPLVQWQENRCQMPLCARTEWYGSALMDLQLPNIGTLVSNSIKPGDVQRIVDECAVHGYEGIVIKNASSMFRRDRSTDWLKCKVVHTEDLIVLGVMDNGKGIYCYSPTCGTIKVTAGFSKDDLNMFANAPALIINRIAEIAMNREAGNGAARNPRFLRWREDKQ